MTSLQELVNTHQAILLDSSVLCGAIKRETREGEQAYQESLRAFFTQTKEIARKTPQLYITQGVFNQLTSGRLDYKRINRKGEYHRNKTGRIALQNRKRTDDKRRKLIQQLYDNDRCLNYTNPHTLGFMHNPVYEDLAQRMQPLIQRHELSETNYEFLVSACTLAQQGLTTAMLSNTSRIYRTWNETLSQHIERITPQTLAYYWMPEVGVFEHGRPSQQQ